MPSENQNQQELPPSESPHQINTGGGTNNLGTMNISGGQALTGGHVDGDINQYNAPVTQYITTVAAPNNDHSLEEKAVESYWPLEFKVPFQEPVGAFKEIKEELDQHKWLGLVGMAGVGKSRLAYEFGKTYKDHFSQGIFWLTLENHQPTLPGLKTEIAGAFEEMAKNHTPKLKGPELCKRICKQPQALLVVDGLNAPNGLRQALLTIVGLEENLKCHVIYTSRYSIDSDLIYRVEVFDTDQALQLLLKDVHPALCAEDTEQLEARKICEQVNGLPMALAILNRLLKNRARISLSTLSKRLEEQGSLTFLSRYVDRSDSTLKALSDAFRVTWEEMSDEKARLLFKVAAYLNENGLLALEFLGLLSGMGEDTSPFESLHDSFMKLRELNFIEVVRENRLTIHPLLGEFGRFMIEEEGSEEGFLEGLLNPLKTKFPPDPESLIRQISPNQAHYKIQLGRALKFLTDHSIDETWQHQLEQIHEVLADNIEIFSVEQPNALPGFLQQQLYNNQIIAGQAATEETPLPGPWLRLLNPPQKLDVKSLTTAVFSGNGHQLLISSLDGTTRLIGNIDQEQQFEALVGHDHHVVCAAFSSDQQKLVTGSHDATAIIWDTATRKPLKRLSGHTNEVTAVVFSATADRVAVYSKNGKKVQIWQRSSSDLTDSYNLEKELEDFTHKINLIKFDNESQHIITILCAEGTWQSWDLSSGTVQERKEFGRVTKAELASRSNLLLIEKIPKAAEIWNIETGTLLYSFQEGNQIVGQAFSPEENFVLTYDTNHYIFLWDIRDLTAIKLLAAYHTQNPLKAVHWQTERELWLVDGGEEAYTHFYKLKLEILD